jgi:hypothetical protein
VHILLASQVPLRQFSCEYRRLMKAAQRCSKLFEQIAERFMTAW